MLGHVMPLRPFFVRSLNLPAFYGRGGFGVAGGVLQNATYDFLARLVLGDGEPIEFLQGFLRNPQIDRWHGVELVPSLFEFGTSSFFRHNAA